MARVMVVDDETDIRELLRINIELSGHEVVQARDGVDALARLEGWDEDELPQVLILDLMMPGIDGWEVLSRLKSMAEPALAEIPVIVLTARAADLDRIRGGIEGAVRYLTKPFSMAELNESLDDALGDVPEPVQRRQAQHAALERLARIEKGETAPAAAAARPRITHLERTSDPVVAIPRRPRPVPSRLAELSPKQVELLDAVSSTPSVREAAERLDVSRSNVYASLRRIARKLEVRSVPELVVLARQGALFRR